MPLKEHWFTEQYPDTHAAFSMTIKEKLHEERTPYQLIEIFETEYFGTLMVIDGCVMLTDRDNFIYHEMLTHPAIFTHINPKRVLIIGGGDCGTLKEVLKHEDIEEAWQVEIDERVTRLAEQYFPALCEYNHDPRAHFYFGDGIKWVADTDPESYDIIIIDSTDPVGPAEGLFSKPFYQQCHKALRKGGIIVQQSESPLFHLKLIGSMRNAMKESGFDTVQTLNFPQCTYPSGWWSATMAGKTNNLNNIRIQDIIDKPFETQFYNLNIHQAAMAYPEFFRKSVI
jgi:spermidine synthase